MDRFGRYQGIATATPEILPNESIELRMRALLEPGFTRRGRGDFVYEPGPFAHAPGSYSLRIVPYDDLQFLDATPAGAPSDKDGLQWEALNERYEVQLERASLSPEAATRAEVRAAADWTWTFIFLLFITTAIGWLMRAAYRVEKPWADDWILVLLTIWASVLFFTPHLTEDNLQYVAYARSLLLDHDISIVDEYYLRNSDSIYAPDPRVPYGPVGAAVFWLPAMAAAHVVNGAGNLVGIGAPADGMSMPYLIAMQLCAVMLVTGAWLMAYRMARRRFSRWTSLLGVAGAALGTNALLFQYMWTGASHAPSLFLATAFLYLLDREKRSHWLWLLLGIVAGMLIVTRSQNMLLMPLATLVWFRELYLRGRDDLIWTVALGFIFVGGMIIGYLPQAVISWGLDGSPLSDLYGVGRGRFNIAPYRWLPLLFGGRAATPFTPNGVLTTMPILFLSMLGLVAMLRKEPFTVLVFVLAIVSQVIAVTAYIVWWGRMFGATSYLINMFAVGAVGLAACLTLFERRLPSLRAAWALLVALLCLPNIRSVMIESAWRHTSLPSRSHEFFDYVHWAVFLPNITAHENWFERHGNIALPIRNAVEGLRNFDIGMLLIWFLAFVLCLAAGRLVAPRLAKLFAARRGPQVVVACFCASIVLFSSVAILKGFRTGPRIRTQCPARFRRRLRNSGGRHRGAGRGDLHASQPPGHRQLPGHRYLQPRHP